MASPGTWLGGDHQTGGSNMTQRIAKVISGGQTGADTAGLTAAASAGIRTGGIAPKGYRTECGANPALKKYGLREHASDQYPPRTAQNVADADATLIIAETLDTGSALTRDLCLRMGKPVFHLALRDPSDAQSLTQVTEWINRLYERKGGPLELNIAGNRESRSPGIEHAAELFLAQLFRTVNA
jgi:hypothetical protein